jgi:hypothetical protein
MIYTEFILQKTTVYIQIGELTKAVGLTDFVATGFNPLNMKVKPPSSSVGTTHLNVSFLRNVKD